MYMKWPGILKSSYLKIQSLKGGLLIYEVRRSCGSVLMRGICKKFTTLGILPIAGIEGGLILQSLSLQKPEQQTLSTWLILVVIGVYLLEHKLSQSDCHYIIEHFLCFLVFAEATRNKLTSLVCIFKTNPGFCVYKGKIELPVTKFMFSDILIYF